MPKVKLQGRTIEFYGIATLARILLLKAIDLYNASAKVITGGRVPIRGTVCSQRRRSGGGLMFLASTQDTTYLPIVGAT
ncbi:hypothetical protein [Anabaenopsis elenkinii]|uniref:Uncharacterized protein n=1 Tax=Anabaenopsis elenkinii CCIBt3563 TaxID=2779889 RepID=A0A7S6RD45_9CYAN|nr:hypothetical protein [Anabaenopsis elenkinii]QOV22616.1 hypothetical protein IM676_18515 [Anabaenopsis elenkinii CCIBt3563]